MTLSVLEGHFPIAFFSSAIFLHLCFYFSIYFYCYIYVWYVQIKKQILTYLLTYFRTVGLCSHCMLGTLSQCIGSEVVLPLDSKFLA